MIQRVLEWLSGHDVDEAVLSLRLRSGRLYRGVPQGQACGIRLHYAVEESPLDTAGAIRFAAMEGVSTARFWSSTET